MQDTKTYRFPRLLKLVVAMLVAAGVLIVSVSAVGNKEKKKVSNIQINIQGNKEQVFVSQNEILTMLNNAAGKPLKSLPVEALDLTYLEKQLIKHDWIKKVELFIDNRNVLRVNIEESKPVARVFNSDGSSFYLSGYTDVLPLSDRVSARVPVFTNFTGNTKKLNRGDSMLFGEIIKVSDFLVNHDFWMSQIDQVDIISSEKFEMIPKLGNQIIRFGDASDCEKKFSKLLAFYKQVVVKTGWNKYSVIDVQYKNQVVAEKRDAAEIKADSLAAIRIMKGIIEDAKNKSNDSTHIQLPSKESTERIVIKNHSQSNSDDVIPEIIPEKISPPESSVNPLSGSDVKDEDKQEASKEAPKAVMNIPVKNQPKQLNELKKDDEVRKEIKTKEVPVPKAKEIEKKPEKKVPKAVMPPKSDH